MIGASPSGKAPGFDLGIRWFESSRPCHFIKKTEHTFATYLLKHLDRTVQKY